jgi:outer membrane receptor protein involved in Fe transport
MRILVSASLTLLLLSAPGSLFAQILTGSISGVVQDSSGLAVPAAGISLAQTATGLVRTATSDATGNFVFTGLEAGEYSLSIAKEGFKRFEAKEMHLVSGQRLAAGTVTLELGTTSETITVRAESAAVQTQSAERASVVTSSQIDGLLILGRNPTSLVGLLPGVVVTQETQSLDRDTNFNVLGNRRTANNVTIDGVPTVDLDNGFSQKLQVNMDAVREVQVLLSNYQAEYGRNTGSNVNVVTKSGTREFHGTASYFKRHEQFNATNFFDNFLGQKKPRYRYNTWSYNVGGPVAIGRFNRGRDKLFFFWSQEFWPITQGVNRTVTMPTDLERAGDFSQSRDVNNALIPIRDPIGGQPFPGNRIPANRLDPSGVALLKAFDPPNFFDRNLSRGNYNYVFNTEINAPKRSDLLKADWNINPKNQVYVTYTGFNEVSEGSVGSTGAQANWPQMRFKFQAPNKSLAGRYTRIFSPVAVNELQVGWLRNPEKHTISDEELRRNQRDAIGFVTGQFNPSINPLKIIPNATFGGVPSAASFAINGRFPADNRYDVLSFTDKFTLIRGAHTFKTGAYFEWDRRDVNQGVAFNGNIDFGRNVNNPLDSGYTYSNAALGVFNSYSEPSARPRLYARSRTLEFFAQDNWRINSRLTLDYGVRFNWIPPIYDAKDGLAGFGAGLFDPAKAVKLIEPALNAQNQRIGLDPVTRTPYPATAIGAVAPNSGDTANGLVVSGQKGFPRALMEDRGIHYAPRLGFAYDPFGKGKTAVRGGVGMFYNRLTASVWLPLVAQPPLVRTPLINFGRLSTLLSSSGLLFPSNTLGLDRQGKVPTVTNYSLSVQQNIGWGVVVDASYAATLGRHLYWNRDVNAIPTGANFNPGNFDRTLAGGRPLPPAFLRPLIGSNSVNITEPASSSNYHSFQFTADRRFARGFQMGVAWTWSKSMDYNSTDTEAISALVPVRVWNYGMSSFDRTHVVKINWLYDVPSTPWKRGLAHWVLNQWQASGITSFVSGSPLGIGLTTVSAVDITGTPSQGARVVLTGNPVLPKGERTFYQNFRTDVFALPATGTYGNAARSVMRGPGINNFDIAVFKNFSAYEKLRLQFRIEMYNAFNHTQFNGLDTTTRFDNNGRQVNTRLGQFTSARDPRQIQFALRLYF